MRSTGRWQRRAER